MLLTVTRLSLSHAGLLLSQSVGVWPGVVTVPPADGGPATGQTRNLKIMVSRGLTPGLLGILRKTQFLRYYSMRGPTRVNTKRSPERETLLYRLGSELNRTVSILVETILFVAEITRDFSYFSRLFASH